MFIEVSAVVVKPGLVAPEVLLSVLPPGLVVRSGLSYFLWASAWLVAVFVLFGE